MNELEKQLNYPLGETLPAIKIAAGLTKACVLLNSGAVQCWGNQYGDSPVPISGFGSGVIDIAVGAEACALTAAGGVKCWQYLVPADVSGLTTGVKAIAAGGDHSCALMNDGTVKCWGSNYYGQLGDGSTSFRSVPVVVYGLTGATAIAAGEMPDGLSLTAILYALQFALT